MNLFSQFLITVCVLVSLRKCGGAVVPNKTGDNLLDLFTSNAKLKKLTGLNNEMYPTVAQVQGDKLNVNVDQSTLVDAKQNLQNDIHVLTGNGIQFKATHSPNWVDISISPVVSNLCGVIIGSGNSSESNIKRVQVLWRPNTNVPWDLLSVPNSGEKSFVILPVNGTAGQRKHHVLMVDPVPASQIRLNILQQIGKAVTITVALITGCSYPNTQNLNDCKESMSNNAKFLNVTEGHPISIVCNKACNETLPCWGYKVYTADSPICYSAIQVYGRQGDGHYFIYPIQTVVYFRSQINPLLNNGIFCRLSQMRPGFAFGRYYYDLSKKEHSQYMNRT